MRGFPAKAADEIVQLLEHSQGRAFCLFTSYCQMNDLFERVRTRVGFPLLLQGTAPRSVLLERFKNTAAAVLFATSSFWQGVDVPGEQLSLRNRGPLAICSAQRSYRCRPSARVAGRRPQSILGISGAASGSGAETRFRPADSNQNRPRRPGARSTPASNACPMVKFSWNRCRITVLRIDLRMSLRFPRAIKVFLITLPTANVIPHEPGIRG